MIAIRLALLSVCLALAACATSDSRWAKLQSTPGPRAEWARCINDRAWAYLDVEKPARSPSWYSGTEPAREQVKFFWVLAQCAEKMTGVGWDHLQPREYKRVIADAYWHFFTVQAEVQADSYMKTI